MPVPPRRIMLHRATTGIDGRVANASSIGLHHLNCPLAGAPPGRSVFDEEGNSLLESPGPQQSAGSSATSRFSETRGTSRATAPALKSPISTASPTTCSVAKRPKPARLANDPELRAVVSEKLDLEWSPEQIATHLKEAFPEQPSWHICPQTIYQTLYIPVRGGLTRNLTRKLRTGRSMRRRRRRPDARRVRFATPGASISTRPFEVLVRAGPATGRVISSSAATTARLSALWSNATAATPGLPVSPTVITPMSSTSRSVAFCRVCGRAFGSRSPGIKAERCPSRGNGTATQRRDLLHRPQPSASKDPRLVDSSRRSRSHLTC
jgi:hypothetical protein